MPLMQGKSKGAFQGNLKAEMNAGKPQKQALAIAYSIKRKNQNKAMGGEVNEKLHPEHEPQDHEAMYAHHIAEAIRHKKEMMAEGGMVDSEEELEIPGEEHEEFLAPDMEEAEEQPIDEKEKRKQRLKAIFSR